MKISTKSRYGIRALADLYTNYREKPVSIKEIAERQNISKRYLENIFYELANAGLLCSVRGKGGGFYPALSLNELTILKIIEVLEGNSDLVTCGDSSGHCSYYDECNSRGLWRILNEKLRDSMKEISLADIIDNNDFIHCP